MAGASPLASTVALTVVLALGAVLLAIPLARLILPPTVLPAPFGEQNQDAETLLMLLTFAVILPLAVHLAPRLADRIAAGPNGATLPVLSASLCTGLLGMLAAVKVSERLPWGGGLGTLLVATFLWVVAAGAALVVASSRRRSATLARLAARAEPIWWIGAALLVVVVLSFAFLRSISPWPLLIALAAAGIAIWTYGRVELPRPRGPRGVGLDVVIGGLVFLAVPNLVILRPGDPAVAFDTRILQFHQDFFLGPASHVLGGGAMLVDTLSQYGVGSIDFIAGWFALVGVSNGTLGLLDGLLSGVAFVAAYLVLRMAGVARVLATSALVVGVVALVWGLVYPVGGLLQHGAIRFGLPMMVLAAAAAGRRFPRLAIPARVAAALAVGISSIWALEAFGYTAFTFAGVVAAGAWLSPPSQRRRWLLLRIGEAALAGLLAHAAFASITFASSGSLPDWGLYLSTLRAFLVGKVGDLTYDFSPWSPGIGLGAIYLASAIGVLLLLKRRRDLAERNAAAIVALAGATAYGIALFSYLDNRSADHIVPYVSLPALMVVTLWLSLLLRAPDRVPLRARRGALALSLGVGALLVGVAWSSAQGHLSQSVIAFAPPGGKSLGGAIDRLVDLPPLSRGAAEAEGLLDRYWPGQDSALVVVEPDLGVEALARSGRINVLPLSDPWEDSLVPDQRLDDLAAAFGGLRAGQRILLDSGALASFRQYKRDRSLDPLAPNPNQTLVPSGLAPLQEYAMYEISRSFDLRIIDRSPPGLAVAELVTG